MKKIVTVAAALALALSAAACHRNNQNDQTPSVRPSTIVEPETRVDAVPQEEPAVARNSWRAANDQARAITGNLRVSIEGVRGGPVVFAYATGITVRAQPYAVAPAASRSGVGGQSFAAVLGGDPRVDAYLYRVLDENVSQSAGRGLCGDKPSRYLAVSEFVDGTGRWVFKVAAFGGDNAPGAGGQNPDLCNSYAFSAQ
jgi:hypothetical protein